MVCCMYSAMYSSKLNESENEMNGKREKHIWTSFVEIELKESQPVNGVTKNLWNRKHELKHELLFHVLTLTLFLQTEKNS